jgi:hypothetical protein
MALMHQTTMTPSKLELLAAWLPSQPWFVGDANSLVSLSGFRLDDPAGEFVQDESGHRVSRQPAVRVQGSGRPGDPRAAVCGLSGLALLEPLIELVEMNEVPSSATPLGLTHDEALSSR